MSSRVPRRSLFLAGNFLRALVPFLSEDFTGDALGAGTALSEQQPVVEITRAGRRVLDQQCRILESLTNSGSPCSNLAVARFDRGADAPGGAAHVGIGMSCCGTTPSSPRWAPPTQDVGDTIYRRDFYREGVSQELPQTHPPGGSFAICDPSSSSAEHSGTDEDHVVVPSTATTEQQQKCGMSPGLVEFVDAKYYAELTTINVLQGLVIEDVLQECHAIMSRKIEEMGGENPEKQVKKWLREVGCYVC